jgi:DNA polymerase-1
VAFVLDASGPTFRDALYPQYKANRPPMPEELRAQVQPMRQIVEALGFPLLCVDGVEADDVIGTLAVQAAQQGMDVTISTSDKDFAQLVRPGIALVNTMSGSRMDSVESVMEKFGVRPDQIIDFLALMGDTVDNVPGVEKCGPKTAAKWLAEYDTLDGVMAGADGIKGKIGENLRAALSRLPLNRDLVTIKTDVALPGGPDTLAMRERHTEQLRELYARYGFHQALKELDGGAVPAGVAETEPGRARGTGRVSAPANQPTAALDPALAAAGEYEMILQAAQLQAWIARLQAAEEFAFDSETNSLDPMQADLVGLSFSVEPGKAAYLPLAHDYPGAPAQLDRQTTLQQLAPLFADANKKNSASTASTTCMCCADMAWTCRAIATTPCWRASC